jgi:hypothetical protein
LVPFHGLLLSLACSFFVSLFNCFTLSKKDQAFPELSHIDVEKQRKWLSFFTKFRKAAKDCAKTDTKSKSFYKQDAKKGTRIGAKLLTRFKYLEFQSRWVFFVGMAGPLGCATPAL